MGKIYKEVKPGDVLYKITLEGNIKEVEVARIINNNDYSLQFVLKNRACLWSYSDQGLLDSCKSGYWTTKEGAVEGAINEVSDKISKAYSGIQGILERIEKHQKILQALQEIPLEEP